MKSNGTRKVDGLALASNVLLACLLLGGCMTVGPDYTRPVVNLPGNWNATGEGIVSNAPLDTVALGEWWRVLDDPILDDLMNRAQRSNLDLKQAEARLRQARAKWRLTDAEQLPTVSLGATARRSRGSEQAGPGGTSTTYANSLDAS